MSKYSKWSFGFFSLLAFCALVTFWYQISHSEYRSPASSEEISKARWPEGQAFKKSFY